MDRRATRVTAEWLAKELNISGDITHIQFDHESNIVNIFFTGDGSLAVPEGGSVRFYLPEIWKSLENEQKERLCQEQD